MGTVKFETNGKSKKLYSIFLLCLSVVLISILLFCSSGDDNRQQSGKISNSVYIWQRNWNKDVTDAIEKTSTEMSCFGVLSAEVSFNQDQIDEIVSVPINYEALKSTQKPIAIAFRIGSFFGDFRKHPEITSFLGDIVCTIITEAIENGVEPAELHIDFDCAESKLDSYTELVRVIKERVQKLSEIYNTKKTVQVIITALPCWLKHRQFNTLAKKADGFVLQIHSLEIPNNPDAPIELCDTASSIKWVKKAARIGVPFRVALPTYGYIVGFDSSGKYIGITTEGPARNWPQGSTVRLVSSNAEKISELVNKWRINRPKNMEGIIWYRLPIETDQLNWTWETLETVMNGKRPNEEIKVAIEYPQDGLAKISLVNTGQLDYLPKNNINLQCEYSNIVAADGMNGFVFDRGNSTDMNFKLAKHESLIKIKPGEKLQIGWLRFDGNPEVNAYVSKIY